MIDLQKYANKVNEVIIACAHNRKYCPERKEKYDILIKDAESLRKSVLNWSGSDEQELTTFIISGIKALTMKSLNLSNSVIIKADDLKTSPNGLTVYENNIAEQQKNNY